MDGFLGQGRHRLSVRFMGLTSNKKSLAPPGGARTENTFSAVPPCLPLPRPLGPAPTRRCPVTQAMRRKILRPMPVPPALCGPFAVSHFRSALSTRNSLWTRMTALLPHRRFKICYAYLTPYVCVCQELFFACGGHPLAVLRSGTV